MPPAPFLPGGFELLREKSEGRPALVFVRCTRMPGGEAELQQFRIIHPAEVCAESFKGARLKHRVLLGEKVVGRIARQVSSVGWSRVTVLGRSIFSSNPVSSDRLVLSRSVSENSSLVLLNSLEKERKGVRIIRNHGENLPILPSRTRFTFTS